MPRKSIPSECDCCVVKYATDRAPSQPKSDAVLTKGARADPFLHKNTTQRRKDIIKVLALWLSHTSYMQYT